MQEGRKARSGEVPSLLERAKGCKAAASQCPAHLRDAADTNHLEPGCFDCGWPKPATPEWLKFPIFPYPC